jgi:hypothetical protein
VWPNIFDESLDGEVGTIIAVKGRNIELTIAVKGRGYDSKEE